MRRRQPLRGELLAAAGTAFVVLIVIAFAFAGRDALSSSFSVRAEFSNATQLRTGNPVRLAGVEIGKVSAVTRGPAGTAIVTLRLNRHEDLHADTGLSIQPRLFFEGNFYVKVSPGTPSAPALADGATIPLRRTAVPVQLDQVISTLNGPVRSGLVGTAGQLASGLGGAQDTTGADGLRTATRELARTLGDVGTVARAARGTRAGDLHRAVQGAAAVTGQLAQDPAALAGLVTNYNRVFAALASHDGELSASVRELNGLLRVAPTSLTRIDAALPAVSTLATELRPVLTSAPPALRSTTALLQQLRAFTRPAELPQLVDRVDPVLDDLPALQTQLTRAFPYLESVARCVATRIVPTLKTEVPDEHLSTGRPVWQDLMHMATALAGASPNFDGNGTTIRLGVTESQQALAGVIPGIGEVVGGGAPQGVRPTWLGYGVEPPYRPDTDCSAQTLPDLSRRAGGPPSALRSVKAPGISERDRKLAGLLKNAGTPAGRRTLLQALLDRLPKTAAPAAAAKTAGGGTQGGRPVQPLLDKLLPPAGNPARPSAKRPLDAVKNLFPPTSGSPQNPIATLLDKLTGGGR